MKRAAFLLVGLVVLACSKGAPSRAVVPPWQWVVTGMKPGSVAAEPALQVCDVEGKGCEAVKAGVKLSGAKLLRLERGVSEFELDAGTRVEVGEGSELLLTDAPRTLELRAGGIVVTRTDAIGDAGPLTVKLLDRTLLVPARASILARREALDAGELFVSRGSITMVEPVGAPVPARVLHAGEGATLARKAPPNLQAVFAGQVSRFKQAVLAVVDTPPPPQSVTEPRGLGTMTARVPGTSSVVDGVRLAQHRVQATVRDGVAHTLVEEVFHNDTDRVLEGRYVFPLPPDASITGLTLFVNDKPVEGELVEKKRAAAIFKNIVDDTVRPRDPALLEWVRGSQFSLKVFPLPAHGSRQVILRYEQVLAADGGHQAYVYPLSFGAERRTPIDELSIDVSLSEDGRAVGGVKPAGYAASVTETAQATRVTLRVSHSAPDHDFAVSFARPSEPGVLATSDNGFVALRLRAELPPGAPAPSFVAKDRVLVLDASGSQSAESFAGTREILLSMLRGLEPDERFAVLVCDSACDSLPKTGVANATGQVIDDAVALVNARKPRGASDLAGALRAAAERVPAGAPVQVVYLGDGSASAGELSVSRIATRVRGSFEQRKVDLRLFGAGPSIDAVTLRGLARALSGSYDEVASGGSLAEQAEVLTTGLRAPLLVAPSVEVSADVSELEPRVLPSLRLGEELIVTGKRNGTAPFSVTLRGRLNGEPYALTRPVSVDSAPGALPFAARSWASARISELEANGDASSTKELIELSRQFRVMSRETSWLVLESEQMFADLGIPRSAPLPVLAAEPGKLDQGESRDQELQELGARDASSGTPSAQDEAAPAQSRAPSADKAEAKAPSRAAPAPPAAPPPAAPAPAAGGATKPGASGGGLAGIGSSGSGVDGIGSGGPLVITGPQGNVALSNVSVSGGTLDSAPRVVAGMRAGFRACYVRGLQQDPGAAGTLRLVLQVGASGEVTNVTPSANGSLPAAVVACVVARAKAASFTAPSSGTPSVRFQAVFNSQPQLGTEGRNPLPAPPIFEPQPDVAVLHAGDELWTSQGQPQLDRLQADLASAPNSRKKHEGLIRALLLHGRFGPALNAAERFVDLDPDLPVARELLAYAAVATGDPQRATLALDCLTEAGPNDLKAQGRAARAFESLGDEPRACAHWRSLFELAPSSDAALFESLRCRARAMNDREGALLDARAVAKPGTLLQKLLPLLEAGNVPAFEKSSGSAGQFEVTLRCDAGKNCPFAIVITPTGTVFSPWTPGLGRSSPSAFAFSGLMTGAYHVLLIGGSPDAKGQVEVRALNVHQSFAFTSGHAPTIATAQVTMAPTNIVRLRTLNRF